MKSIIASIYLVHCCNFLLNISFFIKLKDEASKLLKRSLRQLIRNAKPSKDELKAQKTVEKKLSKFLKVRAIY